MNKLLKSSTNRKRIRLLHIWTHISLFWCGFGFAWNLLAEKSLEKWRWFLFFVVATRLSCKTMCTITTKQHCRFLVLKRNFQNWAAGFALLTVVENNRFISWIVNTRFISTCWTKHIYKIFLILLSTHNSSFLILVDWNGTLSNSCLLGTKFIFFQQRKIGFCLFLSSLRALVT